MCDSPHCIIKEHIQVVFLSINPFKISLKKFNIRMQEKQEFSNNKIKIGWEEKNMLSINALNWCLTFSM
ncbi:hypothetical protein DRR62_23130 [Escherichia coli]|nr:hypothetical protein [Escherichia coli]EFN8241823.1 hypothetical protein [Escherichia coli]EFO2385204.1 hypothetical protein [Escherichia coli]MIA07716.1 hypothetical protein [Escherichia coli]